MNHGILLTYEEEENLRRRGFVTLNLVTKKDFYLNTIAGLALAWLSSFFIFLWPWAILILIVVFIWLFLKAWFWYVFSSQIILSESNITGFWYSWEDPIIIKKRYHSTFLFRELYMYLKELDSLRKGGRILEFIVILGIFFWLGLFSVIVGEYFTISSSEDLAGWSMIILFLWTIFYTFSAYFFNYLVTLFHPILIFSALSKKIQSLTPLVEEKSREIQKNFQEDMNFSVLSDRFDSIASTFSEIITLVIKLEKIETKANKGNIFDSEKYINSLRVDILVPLKSLKSFLETQKEELGKSHWELKKVRVRVGWVDPSLWSGWQEQKELASKRSESLLMELTENIERLDTMIQKIA